MVQLLWILLLFASLSCENAPSNKIMEIDTIRFKKIDLLWDLKGLCNPPSFKWIDSISNVRSLVYESVPFEGKPTYVFAYYSNPDLLLGEKPGKSYPGVVLIHGGRGTAYKEWVEKWAAEGYAAIAMDLNGKGKNGEPLSSPGPIMNQRFYFSNIDFGNLKDMWSYHAVARVILAHSFLLSRPEVNNEKTCLTGISWGGYLTCLVASIDNRFKAAVPVYGCGYYNESDVFRDEFLKMTPKGSAKWMKYFDPSSYLPYATQPILFINGNVDFGFNIVQYSKSYNLAGKCEKSISIRPNMQHGHLQGWQPIEIKYFFESKLNGGIPLPKVAEVETTDSICKTSYTSTVGLRAASFYYSSDTISTNQERIWSEISAQIDQVHKTISCNISDDKFQFAFFFVTDHREVSVSSPVFVKSLRAGRFVVKDN